MKIVPAICTFIGAMFSCTNYFRVIFTGGVGKNGSTIAVSSNPIGTVSVPARSTCSVQRWYLREVEPFLTSLPHRFVISQFTFANEGFLGIPIMSSKMCVCVCVSGNQCSVSRVPHRLSNSAGDDDLQEVCRSALPEAPLSLYSCLWLCVSQDHQ